jgi:hypothetical protein
MDTATADHDLLTRLDERMENLQTRIKDAEGILDALRVARQLSSTEIGALIAAVTSVSGLLIKLFW